jgi:hypothetical protein
MLSAMFGGGANPASAAMPYVQQVPDVMHQYFDPYVASGQDALSTLTGQYQTLLDDPSQIYNQMAAGYTQSPGYQWNYDQAMKAATDAAAAGGMSGTPASQQQAATMASGVAAQDFNPYMQSVLGLYGQGLQGEQALNQMGYQGSKELAESLANNLMTQGTLAFQGQEQQNKATGDLLSGLLGAGTSLGTAYMLSPFL